MHVQVGRYTNKCIHVGIGTYNIYNLCKGVYVRR